jgi:hypothetical protein
MKHVSYEVQVSEEVAGLRRWSTAVSRQDPEEAERIRVALEKAYDAEHVRVRKVTTQEVYETVPGRTALGRQRIKTSQGNVDVSVTNESESVIRLPGRGVVIYLNGSGILVSHPIGANGTDLSSGVTMLDTPLMDR